MNDVDKSFYHDGSPTASASKDAFLFDLSENYSIICKDWLHQSLNGYYPQDLLYPMGQE
jgi:hypothetical protein